jgi:ABC-type spermidine/putrescine transport system permease subunit II
MAFLVLSVLLLAALAAGVVLAMRRFGGRAVLLTLVAGALVLLAVAAAIGLYAPNDRFDGRAGGIAEGAHVV